MDEKQLEIAKAWYEFQAALADWEKAHDALLVIAKRTARVAAAATN